MDTLYAIFIAFSSAYIFEDMERAEITPGSVFAKIGWVVSVVILITHFVVKLAH